MPAERAVLVGDSLGSGVAAPHATLHLVPNAGHELAYAAPAQLLLRAWLHWLSR